MWREVGRGERANSGREGKERRKERRKTDRRRKEEERKEELEKRNNMTESQYVAKIKRTKKKGEEPKK